MRRFLSILFIVIIGAAAVWFFAIKKPTETPPGSGGNFKSFFSLGNNESTGGEGATEPIPEGNIGSETQGETLSPFKMISHVPVAGFTVFTTQSTVTIPAATSAEKSTIKIVSEQHIRYVARDSGYVYEIIDGGTPTQISNIFIPNIYEAVFADAGKTAIVRFLKDDNRTVATYSVPIPELNKDNTRTQHPGTYFPDGLDSITVSADGKSLIGVTAGDIGSIFTIYPTTGGKGKTLFTHPFSSWIALWPTKDIYLQTKAAATAEGFLYKLNAGQLTKVLGNIQGLTTTISPKGNYLLYSQSGENSITTTLVDMKNKKNKLLSEKILPEKCVWLQNEDLLCAGGEALTPALYPDAWYAGTTHFSDRLYHIFSTASIVDTVDEGAYGSYDAIQLTTDEQTRTLYFVDKTTGYLWGINY